MKELWVTCLSGVAALPTACGATATISRTNAGTVEAKILRSSHDSLFIETVGGGETAIARTEITDIDHPGSAVAVVGGLFAAYGALNIAVGLPKCGDEGGAYCAGVFAPAAIGIPMLIYGLVVWNGSKNAANGDGSPKTAALPFMIAPMASRQGENQHTGAAVLTAF